MNKFMGIQQTIFMKRILTREQIPDLMYGLSILESNVFYVDNMEGKFQIRRLE